MIASARTLHWLSMAAVVAVSACAGDELESAFPRPTTRVDELRPDSPNTTEPPPVFDPGEVVEKAQVPDASVVVHFSRAGRNRVPLRDADDSGVPDFVETVEATYAQVRATYHGAWGFEAPPSDALVPVDNGGDDLSLRRLKKRRLLLRDQMARIEAELEPQQPA